MDDERNRKAGPQRQRHRGKQLQPQGRQRPKYITQLLTNIRKFHFVALERGERRNIEARTEVGHVQAQNSLLNQMRQREQQQQYQQPQQLQQQQQQQQQQHGISSFPSNSSGHLHLPGLQQNNPNFNLHRHHHQQMVNPVGPEMAFSASHFSFLGHAYERGENERGVEMDEANALVPHDQQLLLQHQQHILRPQPHQQQQYHRPPLYQQPQQYHPPQQQQQLQPQQHAMSIYSDLPRFERQQQRERRHQRIRFLRSRKERKRSEIMDDGRNRKAGRLARRQQQQRQPQGRRHQRGERRNIEARTEVGHVEAQNSLPNQMRQREQQQQYQQPQQQQQHQQQQQQQQQHGISSFPSNRRGHLHLPGLQQNNPNLNLHRHHHQQMVNPVGPEMAFSASHFSFLGHAYERWRKQNGLFWLFLDKELKY